MAVNAPHRFPQDPALVGLVHAAKNRSDSFEFIHEICGSAKCYPQLLGDVIKTSHTLRVQLPPTAFDSRGVLHQDTPYISVLSRSGYDFLVAFFAIRAIGGACVPLVHNILPKDAHYLFSRTNTTCILVAGGDLMERAAKIVAYNSEQGGNCFALPISLDSNSVRAHDIEIDDTIRLEPNGPGLVLFTSGTTGRSKGAILPRACYTRTKLSQPGKAALNYYPAHWVGGARTLIISVLTGKIVYSLGESGSAKTVLETLKNYRITLMNFTPRLLGQLKQALIDDTGTVPEEKREEYAGWFKGLDEIRCSGGVIDPSSMSFWVDLTGLPFRIIYTGTEMGGPTIVTREHPQAIGLIGTPLRHINLKLSEGCRGEILIKSPLMLLGYAGDEEATRAAFNDEGYYKTGDVAEIRDGQYYFVGRANSDFALFSNYRIALERVEQSLASLPYVSESCVLAIPDHEARELCAAVIRTTKASDTLRDKINLARVRFDLKESLPTYMLPAILRILKDDEEIPRTVSGKAIKKTIRKEYFATTDWWPHNNPPLDVEYCGNMPLVDGEMTPWDWRGTQRVD